MDIVEAGVGVLAGGLLLAGFLSPVFLADKPSFDESPAPPRGGTVAFSAPEEPTREENVDEPCPDDRKGRDPCDDDEDRKGKGKHHEPEDDEEREEEEEGDD